MPLSRLLPDERPAVFELHYMFTASFFLGDCHKPCAIVENVAVLQNLNERGAFVSSGALERVLHVLHKNVHGARDESCFGTDGKRNRIERAVRRSVRGGLGLLADFRCGRVLAFGEAVNFIVEQKNFQADVAAQHVNGVIAADAQRVTVSGGDPNFQLRIHQLQSGGHGRRASVNGVESKRVHVVREAAGAADAGNHHKLSRGMPSSGNTD